MGLPPFSGGADVGGREALPRSPLAPFDPGELFDWPRLARAGAGIWPPEHLRPSAGEVDTARALADLAAIGYCVTERSQTPALVAFQRRFRPRRCDGRLDLETAGRLSEVRAAFERSRVARDGPRL